MPSLPSTSSSCYVNPPTEVSNLSDDIFANARHYNATTLDAPFLPTNTEKSKSCCSTTQGFNNTSDAYIPLTQKSLQRHNSHHILRNGDKTKHSSRRQSRVNGTTMNSTIQNTSMIPADDRASVGNWFESSQHPQLHLRSSATSLSKNELNMDLGTDILNAPIQHQDRYLYPYPAVISEEDLDHHVEQSEFVLDPLSVQQELITVRTSGGITLSGIGTQFHI